MLRAHVPLRSFFQLREKLVHVFYIDEGPCEVVSIANGLQPGCLCGESYSATEVADGGFDDGEVLYIIYGSHWIWLVFTACHDVAQNSFARGCGVH